MFGPEGRFKRLGEVPSNKETERRQDDISSLLSTFYIIAVSSYIERTDHIRIRTKS
jgi:hypothetical protein